jgi:hypothetical protein
LRALRPSLPVIIETGNMGEQVEQLARAFADVSVLGRPFSLSELKAALAPWTDTCQGHGRHRLTRSDPRAPPQLFHFRRNSPMIQARSKGDQFHIEQENLLRAPEKM